MTASSLTQLSLATGGALAGGIGRLARAGIQQYMRAPLANTAILALVTFTALATSNALFQQTARHPAPLFAANPAVPEPVTAPADATRVAAPVPPTPADSAPETRNASVETTGSAPQPTTASVPDAPVGNTEVFAVQRRLLELGLFTGTVDGYYGPRTAEAIREFERRNGMTPQGALSPSVVQAILGVGNGAAASPQQTRPVAAPITTVAAQATTPPTPAPAPIPAPAPVRETVAASATTTIDSIVAAIDGARGTPTQHTNPPVPVANVPNASALTQPMPPVPAPEAAPVQQAQPAPQQPTQQVALATLPAPAPAAAAPAASTPATTSAPTQAAPAQPAQAAPAQTASTPAPTPTPAGSSAADSALVSQIQRGLASLAFLRGPIDGRPSDELARAIRNFEVYHNYPVTGEVRPGLVDMLMQAGATL
jgi:peptidoglycan hydrolase-like protein with peptidoglycan-binding domain